MDVRLIVSGLSRYIRVFDPAAIAPIVDGEPVNVDVTAHHGPEHEVGGYLVRGTSSDTWDAILALLLTLDADDNDRFHAVMRGCRRLSNSTPEADGLDDLLTEPEQIVHDMAVDREHRRARQGYSTPADARAFLLMARQPRNHSRREPPVNPLVAAYFRAAADETESVSEPEDNSKTGHGSRVVSLEITAAERPRAWLGGASSQPSRVAHFRSLIAHARDRSETAYLARSHELTFLANVLVAGCSVQSRPFTPQEASDAASSVCNLGLEHWAVPDDFLLEHDLVSAFEAGWAVLHEEVSMFVATQVLATISDMTCTDADIESGMNTLRAALTRHRNAGTPWHAREALDVLAMLDTPAWTSVRGLLDEYPTMPAMLTAILDGRTGAISATEFEFISTRDQLVRIREFMSRFPDMLQR